MKLTKEEKRIIKEKVRLYTPLFFRVERVSYLSLKAFRVSLRPLFTYSFGILVAPFILVFTLLSVIFDFFRTLPKEVGNVGKIAELQTIVPLEGHIWTVTNEELEG